MLFLQYLPLLQIKDEKTDKSFWQYIEDTQKLELLRERQVIDLASKVIGLKSENESYLSEANLRTCDTEILTIITRKSIIQDQSSHSTK
ncbi:unnamed protein product [Rhizophagus irregularis]|nr:unnamed protein product [Rhizophagus irregularis]